jgi:hypothetical protein
MVRDFVLQNPTIISHTIGKLSLVYIKTFSLIQGEGKNAK